MHVLCNTLLCCMNCRLQKNGIVVIEPESYQIFYTSLVMMSFHKKNSLYFHTIHSPFLSDLVYCLNENKDRNIPIVRSEKITRSVTIRFQGFFHLQEGMTLCAIYCKLLQGIGL